MALAEIVEPRRKYRTMTAAEPAAGKRFLGAASVEILGGNEQKRSTSFSRVPDHVFAYENDGHSPVFSDAVRIRLIVGLMALFLSVAVSVLAFILESRSISLVGAGLLVVGGFVLYSWITRAEVEQRNQSSR